MEHGKRPPRLILMIVTDQTRADHLGFGGLDLNHTPHLDSIASKGTQFDRAYVTNPVCMPSRGTLATGRWPSAHGTRTNGIPLDQSAETVMMALRRDGWMTHAVGKLHFQTMGWPFMPEQQAQIDATAPDSVDERLLDVASRFGDGTDWERLSRHRAERVELPANYYGFESVDLLVGHGDRCSGNYHHWAADHGVDLATLGGYANSPRPSALWTEVWESGVPAEFSSSAYVAERAAEAIMRAGDSQQPTFLFVSFPDPHHPFCPPPRYAERFSANDMPVPSTFGANHHNLPQHLQHVLSRRGEPNPDSTFLWAPTVPQYREAMAAQVGLLAMVDDAVGNILGAVNAAGLADDTVTIVTSDHGDLMGDHGLMLKHYSHHDAVTRVPLVISGDGISAQRTNALVSNADVAPTILDLTGAKPFRGIQGRTLRAVLEERTSTARDAVLIEEDQPISIDGLPAPLKIRTVVTEQGRLTRYSAGIAELYNHETDPTELTNLIDETEGASLKAGLTERLLDEVVAVADTGRRIVDSA